MIKAEAVKVFSTINCELGEGPIWHHQRGSWFWFDITQNKLLEKKSLEEKTIIREFDKNISVAGIIDKDNLLVASEIGLHILNLTQEKWTLIEEIEKDNPATRSNDGRVHPSGAFWLSTMGKKTENKQGKIYHYFKGKLTLLFSELTIPNAICFNATGDRGYFTDTPTQKIMGVALDPQNGMPLNKGKVFTEIQKNPDGAIIDNQGNLLCAHWGTQKVIAYSKLGQEITQFKLPAKQISCPALGGKGLNQLLVTSAKQELTAKELGKDPLAGNTFIMKTSLKGLKENLVRYKK